MSTQGNRPQCVNQVHSGARPEGTLCLQVHSGTDPNVHGFLFNPNRLNVMISRAQRNRPYCALSEQQTIVEYLDTLKSKIARLQENYDKISQECDALKQAILRQVFE